MILLNWLPELFLLSLLFFTLIFINFRLWSHRSISAFIAGLGFVELCYLLLRQDLAAFSSPLKILYVDSLSYFGKVLALGCLIIFSLGFHFHRKLSFHSKQSSSLFLIFYSIFTIGLFQANNLVLFECSVVGIYLCSMTLVLIESNQSQHWIRIFRQRMLPFSIWIVVLSMIFIIGASFFGSIYLSDWILALPKLASAEAELFVLGFLILLASVIPLGGLMYLGSAPLGLSILYFSLFMILSSFWFRLGVPFFNVSGLLSKTSAQILISIILGGSTLRYAIETLRTRDHHRWFASALPTIIGLSLFLVLLPGEQALPAFYCIALSMLFTFALAAHAFLDQEYRHKVILIFSLVALIGAPPLILGEQLYRLIHNAVASGNLIAGVLMLISWLLLIIAATQMIGKVLLFRIHADSKRKLYFSEYFFVGIYLLCVIPLTAFRPQVISLLNDHPILNLW